MSDEWPARVVLLTSPGCHLCVEARAAMGRVAERTGVEWAEVSLGDQSGDQFGDRSGAPSGSSPQSWLELWREYGDRLPVVILDGKEHGYWEVEEDRLVRDLTAG